MRRIKKHDLVAVISGKDKGKRGSVLELCCKDNTVKVQGIGMVVRHAKARRQGEVSRIKQEESFISVSNVMLIDKKSHKPCRVGVQVSADGSRVRVNTVTREAV